MTLKINILLSVILILCAVGFLYTFVQPWYTATIVSIGRTRTVSSSGKHGRKSHKVVPMVVTFTDKNGVEHTVDATYRWAIPYFSFTWASNCSRIVGMQITPSAAGQPYSRPVLPVR